MGMFMRKVLDASFSGDRTRVEMVLLAFTLCSASGGRRVFDMPIHVVCCGKALGRLSPNSRERLKKIQAPVKVPGFFARVKGSILKIVFCAPQVKKNPLKIIETMVLAARVEGAILAMRLRILKISICSSDRSRSQTRSVRDCDWLNNVGLRR